jgi:hypothetical protein
LNERIGGYDNDGNMTARGRRRIWRAEGRLRVRRVTSGGGLANVPIIDSRV